MTSKPDGRANNHRPFKYDEKKKKLTIWLTPLAEAWLKALGWADYVEKKARVKKRKKPVC